MTMKIDHVSLGEELTNQRNTCLKLCAAVGPRYPKKDPLARSLFATLEALEQLLSDLDRAFHDEVSDAEFEALGHPYYPANRSGPGKRDIGIPGYHPVKGKRKPRFNDEEIVVARKCLVEIGGGLEFARGMLSSYGQENRVNVLLRNVATRCHVAGIHLGLTPATWPLAE